jgi:hypothetical protein
MISVSPAEKRLQGFSDMAELETESGSHFVLTEPGPYLFPDLFGYEGLDNLGALLLLRVFSTGEQRLWIPISYPAARALVSAEQKEIPFETLTGVRRLGTVGRADPVEMPLLGSFVCFRGISPKWRLCEFMTEHGNRVLFSCSAEPYWAIIRALKKRWPSPFTGRNVVDGEGYPRHERRLTSQEAVLMGAKTLAYHLGVKPEQLGIDPHVPKPHRSRATIEKFLRRLDPEGKVTFVSTRKCTECEGFFSATNKKRQHCSDACEAAATEKNRPANYHAKFQRRSRAEKRAKAERLKALKLKSIKPKRCGFCGTMHTRRSSFCTASCKNKDAAIIAKFLDS